MAGAGEMSDAELKHKLLELLRSDEEFRYAVAGLIGLGEVIGELRKLREDFNKLYQKSLEHDKRFQEINKRFEAIERKLLEHDKRFEEIERKLLEHDKRFEAIEKKLLEHDKRFEAIERKLIEHDKRFEAIEKKLLEHDEKFRVILEEIRKIWETLLEHGRRLSRLEDALGALAESTYAKFFLDSVMYQLMGRGERLEFWERNARINDEDVDLLIATERIVYVVEVKVQPRHRDVGALLAKAELVARHYPGKQIIPVLTGTRIGREVAEYARSKGVLVAAW